MFYQPDAIIYAWILPVLGLIILPALWSITCRLYQYLERSRLSEISGFLDLSSSSIQEKLAQERREHSRVHIHGPQAKAAQNEKCCQTIVANVSLQGVCLQNIPKKVLVQPEGKLKVQVRTRDQNFSMFVQPKWSRLEGSGYIIGAEIIKLPSGWKQFVHEICQPVVAEPA